MVRLISVLTIVLALCSGGWTGRAQASDDLGRETATLVRPGQAVEIGGLRTRLIAFYEESAGRLDLTVLLSGVGLGSEVLRSRFALSDGQSHAVTIAGGEDSGHVERFGFARRGTSVEISFAPIPAPGEPAAPSLSYRDGELLAADLPE